MSALGDLETKLDDLLVAKAPFQLPANVKEWIVKFSPWITLVLLILLLPAVLAVIGLGAVVGGVATTYGVVVGPLYWLALIVLIVEIGLMAFSIPALLKRQKSGWNLVFYSQLISIAYAVLNWLSSPLDVIGLLFSLIGVVIGLYILFQIRPLYR